MMNPFPMKKLLTGLLLLAFLPVFPAKHQHVLKTKNLASPDTVWVFTPAAYDAEPAATPVVFLLHGWNGSYHQWNDIHDCQKLADRYGFILVCPDALTDSWYLDSPVLPGSQYGTFFFGDLLPFVDKTYRTDPKNRFITGLSMGGHGALLLYSQHPELFRSAGSISGVLELGPVRNEYGIKNYLTLTGGPSDDALLQSRSVAGNIGKIADAGKEIILSCGEADRFYPMNVRFKQAYDDRKFKATWITGPGTHNYDYWKSAIGLQLAFFADKTIK